MSIQEQGVTIPESHVSPTVSAADSALTVPKITVNETITGDPSNPHRSRQLTIHHSPPSEETTQKPLRSSRKPWDYSIYPRGGFKEPVTILIEREGITVFNGRRK